MEQSIEEILAKYFTGNANTSEKLFVENWRSESSENLQIFKEFQIIWSQSENETSFAPNINSALEKVDNQLQRDAKPVKELHIHRFIKYAATIVILLTSSLFVWNIFHEESVLVAETHTQKIELLLPDGTRVWLNRNSRIEYPNQFENDSRIVYMDGEAYFDVQRDTTRPFIIKTKQTTTTVLGTEFNLVSRNNLQNIMVTEGKVLYISEQAKTILTVGETATLKNNIIEKKTSINTNKLAWKTGVLIYKNTPLQEVFQDLRSLYNIEITTKNDSVNNIRFNAELDNRDVDEIFEFLEISIPNISITALDNTYEVDIH